jgi:hypothetical protein
LEVPNTEAAIVARSFTRKTEARIRLNEDFTGNQVAIREETQNGQPVVNSLTRLPIITQQVFMN